MDARSLQEASIFSAARRLPAEERASYLDGACAVNPRLRRQPVRSGPLGMSDHQQAPGVRLNAG